jgi:aldehyde dehydrogenase (NAD+)
VYVHESVKEALQQRMGEYIEKFYGRNPLESRDYMPMVNEAAFNRLEAMLHEGTVVTGGAVNREQRRISPTLITGLPAHSLAMNEEIFGPVLPVIGYTSEEELFRMLREHPKPLALYVFSRNRRFRNRIIREIPSGGCAVNETVMQMTNPSLPFGGVQYSGLGAYHGKHSFEVFSHKKSVLIKPPVFDIPLRYPPYEDWKEQWIRRLMK